MASQGGCTSLSSWMMPCCYLPHGETRLPINVAWCNDCVYLGSPMTSDGSFSTAAKLHALVKAPQMLKFVQFARVVRLRTTRYRSMSNFASSMRASCRLCCIAVRPDPPKTHPVERLYNTCIKALLNVRNTASNELYYAELGLPPVKALVLQRQR